MAVGEGTEAAERASSRGGVASGHHLVRQLRRALHRRTAPALSSKERAALRELRKSYCNEDSDDERTGTAFDPASAETDRQLREAWRAAFPAEPLADTKPGEHWKRLGFQSATPRTDIRAGRLALDQLHHLAVRHPDAFRRLAVEAEGLGYPFACGCFNVTQMLAQFFGLYRAQAVMPVAGAAKASPVQLKSFAQLCSVTPEGPRFVLDELFRALVELLHASWRRMREEGNANLMDFPVALQKAHRANAAFWRRRHGGVADLRCLADETLAEQGDLAQQLALEAAGQLRAALRRAGEGMAAGASASDGQLLAAARGSEVELAWMPPRLRLEGGGESKAELRAEDAAVTAVEDLDLEAIFMELGIDDEVWELGEGPTPADLDALLASRFGSAVPHLELEGAMAVPKEADI